MNLALILCAALASPLTHFHTTFDCESLPQPVIVILECEPCSGDPLPLLDFTCQHVCPPAYLDWYPKAKPPCRVTAYVYTGPMLEFNYSETVALGCP